MQRDISLIRHCHPPPSPDTFLLCRYQMRLGADPGSTRVGTHSLLRLDQWANCLSPCL